jgi:glycosyltransferase involved in cell wall biosynthesis
MSDVSVVISSFNQGELVAEAVNSAQRQSMRPARIIVVDDGSTDSDSLAVLDRLQRGGRCEVIRQDNRGVSAARNNGIASVQEEFVVILDGDDRLASEFIDATAAALKKDSSVVAASSWLRTHGVLEAEVKPGGGRAIDFLHRNACPATAMIRRAEWERSPGYDESMRDGFEDWDFFLSLVAGGGRVEIVPRPLIEYRTAVGSANVQSMEKRLALYKLLIDKHHDLFAANLREVLLAHETRAIDLSTRWEALLLRHPREPLGEVSFGDGGMAMAVRIGGRQRQSDLTPSDRIRALSVAATGAKLTLNVGPMD